MPPEVIDFIAKYGYLAIFIFLFLQEMGIPNPIPNELMLLFTGYLAFKGTLFLPLIILVGVCADVSGSVVLYGIFFFFGAYLIRKKPKWLPIPTKLINALNKQISEGGSKKIYICRLTPYVRGYTSIITGLLQIRLRVYLPIAFISSITWCAIYVITGRLLGPYWSSVSDKLGSLKYILLMIFLIISIMVLVKYFIKRAIGATN